MSYDVDLVIRTGGEDLASVGWGWNYTSNCSPMWREAGANLADFHGKLASDCLPVLQSAIQTLRADPKRFTSMNPPNGWGSYETLLPALEELAAQFAGHPKATVQVSR